MIRRLLPCLALLLAAAARADNPFGLMLWPAPGQDLALTAARAAALGVAWYRPPALFLDRWRDDADCPSCRALERSGLRLAVTIRNGGRDSLPRRPSRPPDDLAAFARTVGAVLDKWKPAMLVVEDEENQPQRYDWETSPDPALAYRRELEAACSAAHARRVSCANGGLSFDATAALTWATLSRDGRADMACDYARRVLPNGPALCASKSERDLPAGQLERAERLLAVYRAAPIDAINIHWHGGDAVAFAQSIDVLSRLAGKPVMSNEIALSRADPDPAHVRPLMRAAMAGHMLIAIWFSVDGADSLSLFDENGRLRPAGEEFAHHMSGRK
jgi:hypothetical protein